MNRMILAIGALMSFAVPAIVAQVPPVTLRLQLIRTIDGHLTDMYHVEGAFASINGELVVGDPDGLRVLVVDTDGRMHSLGRSGEGPGEFRNIRAVGQAEKGGIWVADSRLLRVQIFNANKSVREVMSYPQIVTDGRYGRFVARPVAITPLGRIILHAGLFARQENSGHLDGDVALLATTPKSEAYTAVLWESDSKGCSHEVSGGNLPVPFCVGGRVAVSPSGRFAVRVVDLAGAEQNGKIVLTMYATSNAATLWSAQIALRPRPRIRLEELDSVKSRLAPLLNSSKQLADAYESMAKPRYQPSFDHVIVLENGGVWLGQAVDEGRVWMRIGPGGRREGETTLRRTELPIASAGDVLWTRENDDDGFVALRAYRVWPR